MPTSRTVIALTLAAAAVVAATTAHAEEAPRHSAGGAAWLNVRSTTTTIGLDLQGTYRPGSQLHVQLLYGAGTARIGVACDSGEECGANELRAFVGGGVIGCTGWLCATAGVALAGRRVRPRSDREDADYQPFAELRAAVELGRRTRVRLGGRLETSSPTYRDQVSTRRPVLEVGVISTF